MPKVLESKDKKFDMVVFGWKLTIESYDLDDIMAIDRRHGTYRHEISVWWTQNDRTTGYGPYEYRGLKCLLFD